MRLHTINNYRPPRGGAMIVLSWWVQLVGEQRLTFTYLTTRHQIVWVDSGRSASVIQSCSTSTVSRRIGGSTQQGRTRTASGVRRHRASCSATKAGRAAPALQRTAPRFVNANLVGYGEKDLILSRDDLTTPAEHLRQELCTSRIAMPSGFRVVTDRSRPA